MSGSDNHLGMRVDLYSWTPNLKLERALFDRPSPASTHKYHYDEGRLRIVASMRINYDTIVAQALRGMPSTWIGAALGVSREAIDRRLRPLGLKNPHGVKGRPKSSQPGCTQSKCPAAGRAPR